MASQNELKDLLSPENLMALLNSLPDAEGDDEENEGAEDDSGVGSGTSSDSGSGVPSPYSQSSNEATSQQMYSPSSEVPLSDSGTSDDFDDFGDFDDSAAEFNQQDDSSFSTEGNFETQSDASEESDNWQSGWGDDDNWDEGNESYSSSAEESEGASGEADNASSSFVDPSQGTMNDGGSANFVETGSSGSFNGSGNESSPEPFKPLDLFEDNYVGMGAPAPMPAPAPAPEPFSMGSQMMSSQSEEDFLIPPSELMKILDGFDDFVAQATGGQAKSLDEYMAQPAMQAEMDNARQAAANKTYDFETAPKTPNTASFNGNNFTYTDYNQQASFKTGMLNNDTATAEDKAKAFSDVTAELTEMVEKLVGGFDRVTDLAIISDKLIINGVAFCPTVSPSFTDSLPYDLKNGVSHGCFAWLFDFNSLRRMTRLCRLKVDTRDFVFSKIRVDLGILYDFTPKHLFKVCKDLQILDIAGCVTQASDMDKHKDMFLRQSQAAKMYDAAVSKCWSGTKYCWHSIRSVFKDPKRSALSKIWGISVRSVGMATVGAVTSAGKIGQIAAKAGKGFANFVHMVKDNR